MQSLKPNPGTELKIWEKIRIVVGEGREAGYYEARVEDIINGGIVVTEPVFITGRTLLRNGANVAVQITRDDAAYQFFSRIRIQDTGTSKRAHLSPPRGLKRIQRRLFARVDMSGTIRYCRLTPEFDWNDWPAKVKWSDSSLVNISGGGALIAVDEDITKDNILLLSIELFEEAVIPEALLAVARRVFEANGQHRAGVEFIMGDDLAEYLGTEEVKNVPAEVRRFNDRYQDKLVTFLFHKQIELRQKGLI